MKIAKLARPAKIHKFRRMLADGQLREYEYKYFRVKRADGRVTTVALDKNQYGIALVVSGLSAGVFAQAVRTAAASVPLPLSRGESFSAVTRYRLPAAVRAARMDVTVEDLEHAEANNAAWQ